MSVTSQTPTRRAAKALSMQEKIRAIDRVHDGESKASVARDIGVPESTLRGWCKGEEKLRNIVARSETPSPPALKIPRLEDAPLDFSMKENGRYDPKPEANTASRAYGPKKPENLKQEPPSYWMDHGHATPPTSPPEVHSIDNSAGWFWKWYKSHGVLPQTPPMSADNEANLSGEEDDPPATAADAVYHGEKFLRWLECCSDPSVTALQILQFRYLLNNVKECAERRRQVRTKQRQRK